MFLVGMILASMGQATDVVIKEADNGHTRAFNSYSSGSSVPSTVRSRNVQVDSRKAEYQVRYVIALLWPEREWARAVCVAQAETNGTFYRYAIGVAKERGPFQVHPVHVRRFDKHGGWDSAFIVSVNAAVAYEIWLDDGGNFKQWTTAPGC